MSSKPTASNTRTSSASSSSSSSATNQACAACKYQRRRCVADCILAPYFPADQPRQFLNAHRLFGVRNILKIARDLDPLQRAEAMRSIIFESNVRAQDPVGGCYRILLELERQIKRDSAELDLVLCQLAFYRAQAQAASNPGAEEAANAAVYPNLVPGSQQRLYHDYFCVDAGEDQNNNGSISNITRHSNSNCVNNNDNSQSYQDTGAHERETPVTGSMLPLVDSKNTPTKAAAGSLDCSTKMQPKEEPKPLEHVQEHDLKGVASLFTLSNGNTSGV